MNNVITLSRQLGSQGSYIATEVAAILKMRYLDREILQRAAEIAGGNQESLINEMEIRESGNIAPQLIHRILQSMSLMPLVPLVPSASLREPYIYNDWMLYPESSPLESSNYYIDLVRQVIREFAQEGDALIVGRGGQIILRDTPAILRVLIVAPEAQRVQTIAERMKISPQEAQKRVRQSDKIRTQYMRRYFGVNWLDPLLYDLVINTGVIDQARAVKLITEALA